MKTPLVSIIIPVFNVEAYLNRCLTSVTEQTYRNLEIILVDDGSTDRSGKLCDTWAVKDDRILVIHKENAGAGYARNAGMDIATGKYLFFFDSDDYVDLRTVELCVTAAETHQADTVLYGRYDVYENGSTSKVAVTAKKHLFCGAQIRDELLPGMFTYDFGLGVGSCGRMYRTAVLSDHNIRFVSERELTSEDAYFVLNFFTWAETAVILPESLYFYFKRSSSQSRVFDPDRQKKNNKFLESCISYCLKMELPEKVSTHIKARYHMYTISAMKQILCLDMNSANQKSALRKIFRDPVLQQTLTPEVLEIKNSSQRLFFTALRLRMYHVCLWFLKIKLRKEHSAGRGNAR